MMKSFQVARAAAAGVLAARLAEAGMDGAFDALERSTGLLSAMSPNSAADLSPPGPGFGKDLAIRTVGLSFKKYPVCYCAHRVIDATIDMANAHDLHPTDVRSVNARIGDTQISILRHHTPKTALEAKFSIELAVTASIASRAVGLRELDDGYVQRSDVQALTSKVAVEGDDSVCPVEPAFSLNDRLTIVTEDGRALDSGDIRFARGHARLPLGEGELKRKFLDCCRGSNIDQNGSTARLPVLRTSPTCARSSHTETAQFGRRKGIGARWTFRATPTRTRSGRRFAASSQIRSRPNSPRAPGSTFVRGGRTCRRGMRSSIERAGQRLPGQRNTVVPAGRQSSGTSLQTSAPPPMRRR
jgi:2-methylcitrate dehydratase PrpD